MIDTSCYEIQCEGGGRHVHDADDTLIARIDPAGVVQVMPGQDGPWRRYQREQAAKSRKGATMIEAIGIDEAEAKAHEIGDRVIDATFALKELRDSAERLAQRAGDMLVDAKHEQRKRNLVEAARAMVAALDEVL